MGLRLLGVVQVRFKSSLPGKALLEACGKPLLVLLAERLRFSRKCCDIVIATADAEECEPITAMARKHGIAWYAGAESDLISRYLGVAREFRADGIIRVTGDNALMDPVVVDRVAAKLVEGGYDFAGNSFHPTYPHGMEAEAFSLEYLERLDSPS